jgi:hypothetical protein
MASSVPAAVTSPAATFSSSQRNDNGTPSSSPYQYDAAQANGSRSTSTTAGSHHSDLTCVGTWAPMEEQQDTRTQMDEGTVGPPFFDSARINFS